MAPEPSDPLGPTGPTDPDERADPTPARVGCALPFILGAAVVVGLLLLFFYLLVFWQR